VGWRRFVSLFFSGEVVANLINGAIGLAHGADERTIEIAVAVIFGAGLGIGGDAQIRLIYKRKPRSELPPGQIFAGLASTRLRTLLTKTTTGDLFVSLPAVTFRPFETEGWKAVTTAWSDITRIEVRGRQRDLVL
jgi:hypothetical protein